MATKAKTKRKPRKRAGRPAGTGKLGETQLLSVRVPLEMYERIGEHVERLRERGQTVGLADAARDVLTRGLVLVERRR